MKNLNKYNNNMKYYIIKINDLLTKIKWGENNEKK